MADVAQNTGNALVLTLKRVRTDVPIESPYYHEPMDANGIPTRVSGQPQEIVNNTQGHPNYIAPYPDEDCAVPTYGFVNIYNNGSAPDYTVKINNVLVTDLTSDYYRYFDASYPNPVSIKITPNSGVGHIDHDIYGAPNDNPEIQDSVLTQYDNRINPGAEYEIWADRSNNNYVEHNPYALITNYMLNNVKDEDPHVDVILVPLVNGVNKGNMYASETNRALPDLYDKDIVTIGLARSPSTVAWPVGSTGKLVVQNNLGNLFDSGDVYNAGEALASFAHQVIAGYAYTATTSSQGDSTNYLPVILTQINNSSAPLSTTQPTVVNFRIEDNTNGEMVFDDGTYQSPQINGFNFLDTNGALADLATLKITNNHNVSLRFLVQNFDASTTYWNIDVAVGQTVTLATLPKESVRITYTDTP